MQLALSVDHSRTMPLKHGGHCVRALRCQIRVNLIREDNTLPILCLGLFRHVLPIASSGYMT